MSNAFELVIGLEVHCQLRTNSKIFCGCATSFGDEPNSNTCPVCLGLPGALPVLNAEAVRLAVRASTALQCTVHATSVFARKNYFYPDLPKGYQISQFDQPLATNGAVSIGTQADGSAHIVRIHRVHMEEDAGKSVHDRYGNETAIDLNRAGTPLVEIVSEPDMRSAADAVAYARKLRQILEYADVSDANMEEGSLRVDVNVSVRPSSAHPLGTRTEIKNLNSFSAIERAIELEYARQCAVLSAGGTVEQETMLYDERSNQVRPARSKEGSHDYRYFPEPDLPPLCLSENWLAAQRNSLPELPDAKRVRLAAAYGLSDAELEQFLADRRLTTYFEDVAKASSEPQKAANWVLGPVLAGVNATGANQAEMQVAAGRLASLIRLEASGSVSNTAARRIFTLMSDEPATPEDIAQREGLMQVGDDDALAAWIDAVMEENPTESARFLAGERKLQGVLIGLVMKKSGGAADPKKLSRLLAARAV